MMQDSNGRTKRCADETTDVPSKSFNQPIVPSRSLSGVCSLLSMTIELEDDSLEADNGCEARGKVDEIGVNKGLLSTLVELSKGTFAKGLSSSLSFSLTKATSSTDTGDGGRVGEGVVRDEVLMSERCVF